MHKAELSLLLCGVCDAAMTLRGAKEQHTLQIQKIKSYIPDPGLQVFSPFSLFAVVCSRNGTAQHDTARSAGAGLPRRQWQVRPPWQQPAHESHLQQQASVSTALRDRARVAGAGGVAVASAATLAAACQEVERAHKLSDRAAMYL